MSQSQPSRPSQPVTFDQFLVWSAQQERGRYELIDGEIVEMPSEGAVHNFVKLEIAIALKEAVRAARLPGSVFTDGMAIRTLSGKRGREPDAAVTASRVERTATSMEDPLILVEVVSASSERDDTGDKLDEYFQLPTVRHYLIVRMDKKLIIHHARRDDGTILTALVTSPTLMLDPPGLTLDLSAMFDVCG
jgi:Uma2 family endonuclease